MKSKKRTKDTKGSSTKIAFIFFICVIFILLASFAVKFFGVLNSSKFDGKSDFIIGVFEKDKTNVFILSPDSNTISVLDLQNNGIKAKSIQSYFDFPLDSEIQSNNFYSTSNIKKDIVNFFIKYRNSKSDLTIIDRIRIALFVRSVSDKNVVLEKMSVKNLSNISEDDIKNLFSEKRIIDDGLTIEVVNASGEDGIGNRAARMITNIGGNVILVTTAKENSNNSFVEYKEQKSYTASRLGKIFNFNIKKTDRDSIADLIMVIGKNRGENL